MTEDPGKPYATGARIDATTAAILVDSDTANALCEGRGLSIADVAGSPPGLHPIVFEFWRVREGRAEARGLDQHVWSERTTSATGALATANLAALAGASAGWWLGPIGAWWGASAGWLGGAAVGASAGSAVGRRWSHSLSRAFGTYDEVAITVPGALLPGGRGPFQRVLGMYTNSPVALWTAKAFGYGFCKRLGDLAVDSGRSWTVRENGAIVLDARFFGPPAQSAPPARIVAANLRNWTNLPLLGSPSADRFSVSTLFRDYAHAGATSTSADGELTIHAGSLTPTLTGRHVPVLVVHTTDIAVRLTQALSV